MIIRRKLVEIKDLKLATLFKEMYTWGKCLVPGIHFFAKLVSLGSLISISFQQIIMKLCVVTKSGILHVNLFMENVFDLCEIGKNIL